MWQPQQKVKCTPDEIIPWGKKYYDDSHEGKKLYLKKNWKAMWRTGPVQILVDTTVNILTDCIWLWPPDMSAGVTGLDWNTGNTWWVSTAHCHPLPSLCAFSQRKKARNSTHHKSWLTGSKPHAHKHISLCCISYKQGVIQETVNRCDFCLLSVVTCG